MILKCSLAKISQFARNDTIFELINSALFAKTFLKYFPEKSTSLLYDFAVLAEKHFPQFPERVNLPELHR